MGRFVTDVAAVVANADNLPPKEQLPNVSLWDAFLPKRYDGQVPVQKNKPLDPTVGMRVYREFYNVKKDKDGKKIIVAHKVNGEGSNKDVVMTEDKKKDGNGGNSNGREGSKKGGKEEKKDAGGGGAVEQKPADAEWTPEEDEKLKAMKAENKTWKEIGEVLGRHKSAMQTRFKQIKDTDGGNAGAEKKAEGKPENKDKSGGGHGGEKKGDKKDKQDAKAEKKSKDEKAKNGGSKDGSKAPSKARSGEARFTMGEWMTLQEDDLFSFGELQCLSELIMRDEQLRWLRIASAFADKTGRRVHQDDIREKFEEIGRMG